MSDKIEQLLKQADAQAESANAEASSVTCVRRAFPESAEAENFFNYLKQKLFRIENWEASAGLSGYEHFDENGKVSREKPLAVGDFIRLTMYGSGKNDWVKIINIFDEPDEVVLTVQPSFNPTEKAPDKNVTSHFFTDESTNNFCLRRKNEIISFCVIGLSEKSNTEDTKNTIETIRNFATANLGRYLGIQKGEWKIFCENFLEVEAGK